MSSHLVAVQDDEAAEGLERGEHVVELLGGGLAGLVEAPHVLHALFHVEGALL